MSNGIKPAQGHGVPTQSSLLKNFKSTSRDLSEGVAVTFPLISLRGGKWRYRWKGQEEVIADPETGFASPALEVVIIDASKSLTKIFYQDPYAEGQRKRPDCWSSDGKVPDPSVVEPINEICLTCPKNAFGSAITPSGKAAKACQDRRRIIIAPAIDLENEAKGGPIMLSIPPGSLKNSQLYGDWLDENELAYYGCVTQLSFDQKVSHPKVEFKYLRPLDDDEVRTVLSLRGSETVKRILNMSFNPESAENQVADGADEAERAQEPEREPAPTPAPKQSASAPKVTPQSKPTTPAATAASKAGISEAVKKPATPPPSTRPVQTPQPAARPVKASPLRAQLQASLDEGEEDEQAPSPMDDAFAKLMNLE
jgi:hypothetical protein